MKIAIKGKRGYNAGANGCNFEVYTYILINSRAKDKVKQFTAKHLYWDGMDSILKEKGYTMQSMHAGGIYGKLTIADCKEVEQIYSDNQAHAVLKNLGIK